MIDKIGNRCTGCYSCVNTCPKNCIKMVENSEGFWYPEIDKNACVECDLCERRCPVLHPLPIHKTDADVKVYAVVHKKDEVRENSSSGGAFSAIAEYVLSQGGVVFGAAFDERFDVHHIAVEEPSELYRLRGSKYVQSRIGSTYAEARAQLATGRLVLFSGTACQTSGLIAYLGRDYDNLITQDLICHGVPSPMAWRKYIALRKRLERSDIKRVFFRDKSYGWHDWHIAFWFRNGAEYKENQREDMMIKSFLRGKCSRECCYDCVFKQKVRLADFTLADYWGIEHMAPELDDDKGISSVYVNSPKAALVLAAIADQAYLREMDVDTSISYNTAMVESETMRKDRAAFMKALKHGSFDMVSGKFNDEIGPATRIRWTLRRWLGNKTYEALRHKLARGST